MSHIPPTSKLLVIMSLFYCLILYFLSPLYNSFDVSGVLEDISGLKNKISSKKSSYYYFPLFKYHFLHCQNIGTNKDPPNNCLRDYILLIYFFVHSHSYLFYSLISSVIRFFISGDKVSII
jgi:hypothetical protein